MTKKELQQKVSDLSHELAKKDYKIDRLERDNKIYRSIIEKSQPEQSFTQTNACKRGPWCKACVFNEHHVMSPYSDTLDICKRHMACGEFTPINEESDQ